MKQLDGADYARVTGPADDAVPPPKPRSEPLPRSLPGPRSASTALGTMPGMALGTALGDVRFRPYGIDDGERLRRMSARLSRRSLYTRFWSGTPRIPDGYVRALAALDHWDREAMAALLDGELIGVAEYARDRARPWRADLAVLVEDPWQRRGLARHLVAYLAALAERRGITGFDAEVILENRRARQAILGGWPAARPAHRDGAAHYDLPLPIPAPTPG